MTGLAGWAMRDICPWHPEPAFEVLDRAFVGPARKTMVNANGVEGFAGGVWAREGRPVPLASHFESCHPTLTSSAPNADSEARELPGTWLFGGVVRDHFGHFLVESLARLWALDEPAVGPIGGVLWVTLGGRSVPAFMAPILSHLTGLPPVAIVSNEILQPERLIVPRQEGGSGVGLLTSPELAYRLRRRLARRPEDQGARSGAVYVSRSRLATADPKWLVDGRGQLVPGPFLDDLFAAGGYRVFHPERASIDEQIAVYRGAESIVLEEGSALHLVALVGSSETPVVVLCRRPWYRYLFEAHLRIFLGPEAPVTVRMVEGDAYTPEGSGSRFVIPDIGKLSELLGDCGLPRLPSATVPFELVEEALDGVGAATKANIVRL